MRSHLTKYIGLGLLLVFISSCANIEITKRKYRPGYHVQLKGSSDDVKASARLTRNEINEQPQVGQAVFQPDEISVNEAISFPVDQEPSEPMIASADVPPSFLNVDLES